MSCRHEDFEATVEVVRITENGLKGEPVKGYKASVRVHCRECREAFVFLGPPVGDLATEPTISVDAQELRVPLAPASQPFPGEGLLGFRVNFKEQRQRGGFPG